jgi:hypothetical protein
MYKEHSTVSMVGIARFSTMGPPPDDSRLYRPYPSFYLRRCSIDFTVEGLFKLSRPVLKYSFFLTQRLSAESIVNVLQALSS